MFVWSFLCSIDPSDIIRVSQPLYLVCAFTFMAPLIPFAPLACNPVVLLRCCDVVAAFHDHSWRQPSLPFKSSKLMLMDHVDLPHAAATWHKSWGGQDQAENKPLEHRMLRSSALSGMMVSLHAVFSGGNWAEELRRGRIPFTSWVIQPSSAVNFFWGHFRLSPSLSVEMNDCRWL